ncbi:efflux RND transporter periplasmic adaptor subunit [Mariniblastus fucicola]|uniref:Inner membrane protein YiaV n=1 Tax=Mariniblastus fucicola TaxID=980251 RepID=A0A5B9P9M4_9BACT|nr:efflux RND transporter periplasmic adaptor subunit [Mariniblastus fucicola]QEG23028.1 Inner membrane protein YiaV precursor [Mariniblastus fucicola]
MFYRILQSIFDFLRAQWWALTLCIVTAAVCLLVVYKLVWPAYQNPIARMYTSKLGYSSVLRKTGGAFPVSSAEVLPREIIGKFIGEGLMQSEPVQVPMVAMANIVKVHVVEGQRVKRGDLIIELDSSRLQMKIESARAAIRTAKAELERVRVGTVNVLQEERPDILAVRIDIVKAKLKLARETLAMNRRLSKKGSVRPTLVSENKLAVTQAELELQELQLAFKTANEGRVNSVEIGESAIAEAELTLAYRLKQLEDYKSYASADGIVERVLVHDREYNQDPGRPGVLLASGLWFECYLDQTALGRIQKGDRVEIRLSAYQDRIFSGKIELVRPLVNFALGGPETNRPIRPLGTGAPEWPATFSVRVKLDPTDDLVVPGLTGYATVLQQRNVLTVPRGCVNAVSGNRGIAFVIGDDGESFEPRNVVTGIRDDLYVEIVEGLNENEFVITDGHQVLEPNDRINIVDGPAPESAREPPSEYAVASPTP